MDGKDDDDQVDTFEFEGRSVDAGRRLEAPRHDDATARRVLSGLRVRSPLSPDTEALVSAVMDCAFTVHRALGPGFREVIYKRAFCLELELRGLRFESEKQIMVRYKTWQIPGQNVDLIIGGAVLVELKAVPRLRPIQYSQVLSYLKTLDLRIGLLVNFNCAVLKDGFKRVIR